MVTRCRLTFRSLGNHRRRHRVTFDDTGTLATAHYARANGRKKVTCLSKDNLMKLTDGLFHEVFDEISKDYPDIKTDHWIIDIGTAKLADAPEQFDVIVTSNLYGDIISDVAAEITGSVGLGGSPSRMSQTRSVGSPGVSGLTRISRL